MIRRAVLALPLMMAITACERETSWRQRLTVTVETPAGDVSASSVTEVRVIDSYGPPIPPDATGPKAKVRGEAVAVEVLPGKWLFALLGGADSPAGNATAWAEVTYAPVRDANNRSRGYWERVADIEGQPLDTPVSLPPGALPLMVTFADIADPTSVARVDPTDLAASFGTGVGLKAVTLEITRAEVTGGVVDTILTWLGPYSEPALGPWNGEDLASAPFYLRVTMGDFIRRAQ